MTDMRAKLVVTADASQVVTGMRQAEAAIEGVGRKARGMGEAMTKAGGASKAGVRDLIDATTGVNRSFSSASASAEVFGQALAEQEARYKALKASIDPAYRAERQFTAAQAELNRALAAGVVEAGEGAAMMRRLEGQYERARAAALAFDAAQDAAATGSGRMRGGVQNLSFQIADFATQVGAGTAASVALGQQLPQLLAGFGALGAAAGAVVAIGIPLGKALLGGAGSAEALEKRLTALARSTDAMAAAVEEAATPLSTLRDQYGELADEIDRANGAMAAMTTIQARADAIGTTRSLGKQFGNLNPERPVGATDFEWANLQEAVLDKLMRKTGATAEQAERLRTALADTNSVSSLEDVVRSGEALLGVIADIYGEASEKQQKFLGDWSATVSAAIRSTKQQLDAEKAARLDLLATYDTTNQELKRLTADREAAETQLAKAVAAQKSDEIELWTRVIAQIDRATEATRILTRENSAAFEAMKRAYGEYANLRTFETRAGAAYQEYGQSRRAGAAISSSDAVQASRDLIIRFEGKAERGKWDENANRAGYGSSTVTLADGSIQKITAGMQINWADAERDLDRRIAGYHEELRRTVGGDVMAGFTPQQIAAIASIQHNYGSIPGRLKPALATGDAQLIAQAIAGLAMDYTRSERAQGKTGKPMNYDRRMAEAGYFGDVSAASARNAEVLGARAEAQRDAERRASDRQREADRRASEDQRWRDAIPAELDRLAPSYARAAAAAERWREQALAGLDKTKAGYEQFAAEVEAIYQQRLQKAYQDDLARQQDWAAGVERGLAEIRDSATTWAETSENLVVGWAKQGEEAFVSFMKTGKGSLEDLIDFTLEQLARLSWQQGIQPGLNGIMGWVAKALGGLFGGGGDVLTSALGAAGAPVTFRTAHTGGSGSLRTFSAGASMRPDERLMMLREDETVMTPRMMENTAALVSILGGLAAQKPAAQQIDARPIIQITNNSSTPVKSEIRETSDERGRRQYQMVLSDAVADAISLPGGRAAKTMQRTYGVSRKGPVR